VILLLFKREGRERKIGNTTEGVKIALKKIERRRYPPFVFSFFLLSDRRLSGKEQKGVEKSLKGARSQDCPRSKNDARG